MMVWEKITYRSGYKYQLTSRACFMTEIHPVEDIETKFINLSESGILLVKSGYAWDGPSGPTLDSKSAMRASLAHDALYQLLRLKHIKGEKNRRKSDRVFYELLLKDKMWKVRAKIWWRAVRRWAKQSSVKGRKERTAP